MLYVIVQLFWQWLLTLEFAYVRSRLICDAQMTRLLLVITWSFSVIEIATVLPFNSCDVVIDFFQNYNRTICLLREMTRCIVFLSTFSPQTEFPVFHKVNISKTINKLMHRFIRLTSRVLSSGDSSKNCLHAQIRCYPWHIVPSEQLSNIFITIVAFRFIILHVF